MRKVLFKQATSSTELQQIHALNHRVFAEEIAQHPIHPSGLLVDRFHSENQYFIAVREGIVIGMISVHAGPEFSLTKRLPDANILNTFARPLEVRLLAIDAQERNGTILAGLFWQVYQFATSHGFSHLLISAIAERESMYHKLGFQPLGPAVPEGSASFLPMFLPVTAEERMQCRRIDRHERHWNRASKRSHPISLIPGPVCIDPRVSEAFTAPPVSHRSPAFIDGYERVKSLLRGLFNDTEVALFPGTGTLANDAVAANLKAIFREARGLVLTNGEFGERIANQAGRAGLRFRQLKFAWSSPWLFHEIQDALETKPAWLWAVQMETSTGVLNDTETLLRLAHDRKCAVALDCVSSVGATRVASEVGPLFFATGVSGKSIGAYAGLAFVYLSQECRYRLSFQTLCPSFDLLRLQQTPGPLSTVPSSLVFALARALEDRYGSLEAVHQRFQEYYSLGVQTRRLMRWAGLEPQASEAVAAPNITTFVLPDAGFPQKCLQAGYEIAHASPYLQRRGWGQIATMGSITLALLEPFFCALRQRVLTS